MVLQQESFTDFYVACDSDGAAAVVYLTSMDSAGIPRLTGRWVSHTCTLFDYATGSVIYAGPGIPPVVGVVRDQVLFSASNDESCYITFEKAHQTREIPARKVVRKRNFWYPVGVLANLVIESDGRRLRAIDPISGHLMANQPISVGSVARFSDFPSGHRLSFSALSVDPHGW